MSGKARPSLMRKTLGNVMLSDLSATDKECVATVFKRYNERVEVVRGKDCYYYSENKGICTNTACVKSFYGCKVKADDYCSHGERKEDANSG